MVAITAGKLDFGPWEQIFYGEFDGGRRKRVLIKIIGGSAKNGTLIRFPPCRTFPWIPAAWGGPAFQCLGSGGDERGGAANPFSFQTPVFSTWLAVAITTAGSSRSWTAA